MAMRDGCLATLTLQAPPAQPGHLGVQAGLVNEHQFCEIKAELSIEPVLAPLQAARRSCSSACAVFFVSEAALAEPDIEATPADQNTTLIVKPDHHLVERDVFLRVDQVNDECLVRIQSRGMLATGLAWLSFAPSGALIPADGCRRRNPELICTALTARLAKPSKPVLANRCSELGSYKSPPSLEMLESEPRKHVTSQMIHQRTDAA